MDSVSNTVADFRPLACLKVTPSQTLRNEFIEEKKFGNFVELY